MSVTINVKWRTAERKAIERERHESAERVALARYDEVRPSRRPAPTRAGCAQRAACGAPWEVRPVSDRLSR